MIKKTVVIHQPDFISHLGFFHRFLHADLYIALDHVQFVRNTSRSWTHRDKIKTPQGEKWLTLNVKKAPLDTPINRMELSTHVDWVTQHLHLLEQNYHQTMYFSDIFKIICSLYNNPPVRLVDFNVRFIEEMMDLLDVRIPWVLSSSLSPMGSRNEMLVDLLKKTNATHYLSGEGARNYLQTEIFQEAGMEVVWQTFHHPVYPQTFGAFVPFLSILDVLFNCGVSGAREVLRRKP